MKIKDAILWGFEQLTPTSDSPRVDAELLLAYVLKKSTTFLFTHDKEALDQARCLPLNEWRYRRLIQKRKRGIPVAYLVGHKEFYALDFKVSHSVLVPRPDTEILVEAVIDYILAQSSGLRAQSLLLDVGTGSGCIPISILKNIPGLSAVATDISRAALSMAKENAKRHSVSNRIRFFKSDLLSRVPAKLLSGREIILTANLPYLPDKMEAKPELGFEPSIALYAGTDGMDVYRRLMRQVETLRPKAIFLELYEWQIALLQTQFPGYELRFARVMSGDARCLMMERL